MIIIPTTNERTGTFLAGGGQASARAFLLLEPDMAAFSVLKHF